MKLVKGLVWAALSGAILTGCPKPMEVSEDGGAADAEVKTSVAEKGEEPAAEQNVFAVPQESLANDETALKVTGTITIEGYEKGNIQLDVTRAKAGSKSVQPVTIARYKSPGPFTLYLPAGTREVYLYTFLDIGSDGPTVDDPRGEYADNPLALDGAGKDGISLIIDMANVQQPPPEDRSPQRAGAEPGTGEGDLAAKATTGEAAAATDAGAASEGEGDADSESAIEEVPVAEEKGPPPTPKPAAAQEPPPVGATGDILSEVND